MAASIRITDGTTTLLSLSGSNIRTLEYVPQRPEADLARAEAQGGEGADLLAEALGNVVEPARIAVLDDIPLARSVEGQLQDLFRRASYRARTGEGEQLYWEVDLTGSDGYWRSPLVRGDVELEEGALGWQWAGKAMVLRLLAERRPYFEGARTAISLSNLHGSGTAALTVYNHTDGGNSSSVNIAANQVQGKLPTRAELELTSTSAGPKRAYTFHVGMQSFGDPAALTPSLEAESAAPLITSGTAAGGSNGSYRTFSWSGSAETSLARFTLSSSLLAACRGGTFRLFARTVGAPSTNLWLRARVQLFDVTNLRILDQVQCSTGEGELIELGAVQLPPYLAGETSVAGLSILLSGQNYAGGANSLNLDYLYLMPLSSYRAYRPKGYGLAQNARLVDAPEGIYTDGWAGGRIGHYAAEGAPLMLWPGRAQRLHILQRCDDGTAGEDRTLTVRMWHRPRRVLL